MKERNNWQNNIRKKWVKILNKKMKFKKTKMINADLAIRAVASKEQVFVHTVFLKPGKHAMMV